MKASLSFIHPSHSALELFQTNVSAYACLKPVCIAESEIRHRLIRISTDSSVFICQTKIIGLSETSEGMDAHREKRGGLGSKTFLL